MEHSQVKKDSAGKKMLIGRRVLNAIRKLQGRKGISLADLKKYLRDSKKIDVAAHDAEIKLSLKKGIDRGILTRERGSYKAKEEKSGQGRSKGAKTPEKKIRKQKVSPQKKQPGEKKLRKKTPKTAA